MLSIAWFELIKLLGTRRGWLSIAAFALVWALVLMYAIQPAARMLSDTHPGGLGGLIGSLLERAGWRVDRWPAIEMALYWTVSLYLLPLFAVVIAADQTASDKVRGTLRYLLLRCGRLTLFFGRFAGQMLIQLLLVTLTLASVCALIAWYSPERLDDALHSVPVIVVNLLLVLMPYVALMAAVSVLAKSPRQATLFAMIAWMVTSLLIGFVQSRIGPVAWLDWVLPGSQIGALVRLAGWETLNLAIIPVMHTAALLLFGAYAMWRADL